MSSIAERRSSAAIACVASSGASSGSACPRGDRLARGEREHVSESRWLWVDIDEPARLEGLYAFLAQRPCHLLVSSAGSRGVHCYWRLDRPLPAMHVDERTGEVNEPIERANLRLVNRLGADRACRDRARLLRLLSVGQPTMVGVLAARSFADASVSGRGGGG